MTKDTLRRLRDNEHQTDTGRQIIDKMLNGDNDPVQVRRFFQNEAVDDDQRPDDTD